MHKAGERGGDPPDPPRQDRGIERTRGVAETKEKEPEGGSQISKPGESHSGNGAFSRSGKTTRSPTTGQVNNGSSSVAFKRLFNGALTRSQSVTDLIDNEEAATAAANEKRTRSPGEDEMGAKRPKTSPLEAALSKIKELIVLANEHTTTPRRIKSGILDLSVLLEQAFKDRNRKDDDPVDKIRNRISAEMSITEINQLRKEDWPPEAFIITTPSHKELNGKIGLRSTLVHLESYQSDQNYKRLLTIAPELEGVTEDMLKKLGSVIVRKTESVAITGLEAATATKLYQVFAMNISTRDQIETGDIKQWAASIKKAAHEIQSTNVEVFLPEGCNSTDIRKVLECTLADTGLKVLVRLPREEVQMFKHRNRTETIIVEKTEGKTYSDIVKDLKMSINPDLVGVKITSLTPTLNGDVKIQLKEISTGAKKIMMEQLTNVKSAQKATHVQRSKGIIILDIEEDIEQDDIKNVLAKQLNIEESDVKCNPMRVMTRGTKMISVFLPVPAAEEAIRLKRIKIGWTMCHIKERIDVRHCKICSKIGHQAKECKADPKITRCQRCGDEHPTSTCSSSKQYCVTCESEDHRGNSFKCPIYRSIINDARK